MKANELRIQYRVGNLVYRDSHIARVVGVSDFGMSSQIIQRSNQSTNSDTHSPIPLTEEWLVRFGFDFVGIRYSKDWFYLWKEENRIVFALAEMKYEIGTYLEIKHVHQLQNLYFALTGQELELKP